MNTRVCPGCGRRLKDAWNLLKHQVAKSNPHCRIVYGGILVIRIGRNE